MDYVDDNSTSEGSTVPTTPTFESTLRLYDIFIPLLGLFIISLNLLVVISSGLLLKKRQQPRSTYLFLGNVGLSDLLTGFAVLFGQFYPRSVRSDMSCAIQMGMIVSSTLVSMLSVLLVAIDRFLYILYGLQYQRYIFPNRARILIVTTWIIGIIIGFIPTWVPVLRGEMNATRCWFIRMHPEYVLSTTVIGVVPIFFVLILYSVILYRALKKVNELQKATSAPRGTETGNNLRFFRGSEANLTEETTIPLRETSQKSWRCFCWQSKSPSADDANAVAEPTKRQPSKWRAIKIVFLTTGSFVITWVPYFIASTMVVYCDTEKNPNFCKNLTFAVASPLAILGFSNSLLNPIIYAWWHNGFRSNSIRLFSKRFENVKCCRWCCHKSDDSVASPRTTNLSSSTNVSSSSPAVSFATTSTVINPSHQAIVAADGSDLHHRNDTN